MTGFARGALHRTVRPVALRRGRHILSIAVSVAGIIVAQQHETLLTPYGLLVAAIVGGVIGAHSWSRDGYRLYGNVILGTAGGFLGAWLLLGFLPLLYVETSAIGAMVITFYTAALMAYPVLMSFLAGLFGATLLLAVVDTADRRWGIGLALVGLAAYTAAHLMLLQLRPYLGDHSVSTPLGGSMGEIRFYELLKLFGGVVAFYGLVSLGGDLDYGRVLLACAVVGAAFGGAGVAAADTQFSGALDATELQSNVATDAEAVAVQDDRLHLTVTVRNPTDTSFVVKAGFLRVFAGDGQIAFGALTVANDGGTVTVPARGTATVEYSLALSDGSADATREALRSGETRLVGRHAVGLSDRDVAIQFTVEPG